VFRNFRKPQCPNTGDILCSKHQKKVTLQSKYSFPDVCTQYTSDFFVAESKDLASGIFCIECKHLNKALEEIQYCMLEIEKSEN
jgi:hypothetical protein